MFANFDFILFTPLANVLLFYHLCYCSLRHFLGYVLLYQREKQCQCPALNKSTNKKTWHVNVLPNKLSNVSCDLIVGYNHLKGVFPKIFNLHFVLRFELTWDHINQGKVFLNLASISQIINHKVVSHILFLSKSIFYTSIFF